MSHYGHPSFASFVWRGYVVHYFTRVLGWFGIRTTLCPCGHTSLASNTKCPYCGVPWPPCGA